MWQEAKFIIILKQKAMKKFTLLLAAAAIIGVGSAFTTAADPAGKWVLEGSTYVQVSTGSCIEDDQQVCDYLKTGNEGEHPDQNPANFTPDEMGIYLP
jgi:hypothetical protein